MQNTLDHPTSVQQSTQHAVTLIPGDGIGPEVVSAAQRVIEAAGVQIDWETAEAGKKVFEKGIASGVARETMESLVSTKLALKGPLETPVGYGGKSANVTLRKLFEAFANIRPVRELPGVLTPFSGRGIDLVVVRENVEEIAAFGGRALKPPLDRSRGGRMGAVRSQQELIQFGRPFFLSGVEQSGSVGRSKLLR
jgi:isocitrate/isopropylmalate dehydrogenase